MGGASSIHVCIEPFRASSIADDLKRSGAVTVVESRVEDLGLVSALGRRKQPLTPVFCYNKVLPMIMMFRSSCLAPCSPRA